MVPPWASPYSPRCTPDQPGAAALECHSKGEATAAGDRDAACLFSGDHDDLDADRVVSALCPRVPGRKRHLMLLGGKCYERVIDGTTCDTQTAERVRQFPGPRAAQQQRRSEAGFQQPGPVGRRQSRIAGQPGEDGIGLGEGVAGQRDLLPVPPARHRRVIVVGTDDQRDGDAGVDRDRHLRPASMRAKTTPSSTGVSPAETSTPSSSTSRAVRPAGTTCAPAPYGEMSTLVPGSKPSASRMGLGKTIRPAWSMTVSMGKRYHRIPNKRWRCS